MTQEHKELLFKDLCGRLPYRVKCEVVKRSIDGEMLFIRNWLTALELTVDNVKELVTNNMYEIKPYLLPITSMTAEQKREYAHIVVMSGNIATAQLAGITVQDWFSKNHIDYRGLIQMGLAIDATNKNIY